MVKKTRVNFNTLSRCDQPLSYLPICISHLSMGQESFIHKFLHKGQLISNGLFGVIISIKKLEKNNETFLRISTIASKVIIEKSRGEGSLMEQDTIENVSQPNFFLNFLRKKNQLHSMSQMFSPPTKFFFKELPMKT